MIASSAAAGVVLRSEVFAKAASWLPSAEKATPSAKPWPSGLRRALVDRVAVLVISMVHGGVTVPSSPPLALAPLLSGGRGKAVA